jgi:galactokinase
MSSSLHVDVVEEFERRFGAPPAILVRAPGRVNLIGEHTDYSEGFVMPLAIDRATWIALRPRTDRQVILHSMDHKEATTFDLDHLEKGKGWPEYPKGVAWALQEAGHQLGGWEGTTVCDVPLGAGLSSSASYELAVAKAFAEVSRLPWDAPAMAVLSQKAENQWVGVNCGIMDQMISAVGRANHAVLIDCRNLNATLLPLPARSSVVILDTATRRGLVDSAYNERRRQCEEASAFFGVSFLRDVTLEQLEAAAGDLPSLTRRRARHVISENARTVQAADAMKRGDAEELGELMNRSHESLRHDFEVSNLQLDAMVDISRELPGCLGARMTGAGFGGCAVALVRSDLAPGFVASVTTRYHEQTGLKPAAYVCQAAEGASAVPLAP